MCAYTHMRDIHTHSSQKHHKENIPWETRGDTQQSFLNTPSPNAALPAAERLGELA